MSIWRVCLMVYDSKTSRWYHESKSVGERTLAALKEAEGQYLISYTKETVRIENANAATA